MSRRIFIVGSVFVGAACAAGVVALSVKSETGPGTSKWGSVDAPPPAPAGSPDMIIVADKPAWLATVVTPAVARLHAKKPPLLVSAAPGLLESRQLIRQLEPQHVLFIATDAKTAKGLRSGIEHIKGRELVLPAEPTGAGLSLATTLWKNPPSVVMAAADDHVGLILGAALAAHQGVPVIPVEHAAALAKRRQAMEALKPASVIIATDTGKQPRWAKTVRSAHRVYDRAALERAIVAAIKRRTHDIHNAVVARVPDRDGTVGRTAWLAPYVSYMRRSLVLLQHLSDPTSVQTEVDVALTRLHLSPRTITLLADYDSIEMHRVSITHKVTNETGQVMDEVENVEVEPFTRPQDDKAARFGVGRIPLGEVDAVSTLLLRGFLRDELLTRAKVDERVLIMSNIKERASSHGLPLGETLSRVTAAELHNARYQMTALYRRKPRDHEALIASTRATLVLFEGHINHQALFAAGRLGTGIVDASEGDELVNGDQPGADAGVPGGPTDIITERGSTTSPKWRGASRRPSVRADAPLRGMPLVVLQSCHSLEAEVTADIYRRGGLGVIGSVTRIHSASGGSFINQLVHSLISDGATVGEALRDARNYFYLLQDLKKARNHKSLSQSQRVSWSFRLWGDPEVRVLNRQRARFRRRPVRARFIDSTTLQFKLPRRRLPKVTTEKYIAYVFPGSSVAGMVRKLKNKPQRKIAPLLFARVAVPQGFEAKSVEIKRGDGTSAADRAVFRLDPAGNFAYVLAFPKNLKRRQKITLHFAN